MCNSVLPVLLAEMSICDWLWEKGHIRANNDFSVGISVVVRRNVIVFIHKKKIFFVLTVSTTLCLHSHQI